MTIVPILVGFSLFLAACAVVLFVYSTRNRDHEHADRLSLLPLEDDAAPEGAGSDPGSEDSLSTTRAPRDNPHD